MMNVLEFSRRAVIRTTISLSSLASLGVLALPLGACRQPSAEKADTLDAEGTHAGVDASPSTAHLDPAPKPHVPGQPFFFDSGLQGEECEEGSPPITLTRGASDHACWYAGTSCGEHGHQIIEPFTLKDEIVSGKSTHSGCDRGTYALVYERNTSPLKLRICETRPPPMDCPAMVNDGATWDISALLEANHAKRGVLVSAK